MIQFVPPESVDEVWQACRTQIVKALTKGQGEWQTEEYYYKSVKSGNMVMLNCVIENDIISCGILSICQFPSAKVLFVELLAGRDLPRWIDEAEPALKKYAQQVGATTIEASCRPGLVKKLTRWKPIATVMRLQ